MGMASEKLQAELDEFEAAIVGESDRGLVLVSGEQVSSALADLLRAVLVNSGLREPAIKRGFLGDFESRAKAAYLMGLLPKATFKHIDALRDLRNIAGHTRGVFDLGAPTKEMQAAIDRLVRDDQVEGDVDDQRQRNRRIVWTTGYVGCFFIDLIRVELEKGGPLQDGDLPGLVSSGRAMRLVQGLRALYNKQRRERESALAERLVTYFEKPPDPSADGAATPPPDEAPSE